LLERDALYPFKDDVKLWLRGYWNWPQTEHISQIYTSKIFSSWLLKGGSDFNNIRYGELYYHSHGIKDEVIHSESLSILSSFTNMPIWALHWISGSNNHRFCNVFYYGLKSSRWSTVSKGCFLPKVNVYFSVSSLHPFFLESKEV
jgi:hypothetical protein